MFTGIILGLGVVKSINYHDKDAHFSLCAQFHLNDLQEGESMAVNGACLSIETQQGPHFTVYASAETLSKTTLSHFKVGQKVNLERALALGERLGGHLVSGHIDGLATLVSKKKLGQSQVLGFNYPSHLAPEIIPKGSVALDGISLTLNHCTESYFEVNVIPDTQKRTICASWEIGSQVNLETDILGKYVHRVLTLNQGSDLNFKSKSQISDQFLRQHGFI
ncbi:MAG: riboflavin synthase [Desulfovibrionaceae bacterium]|nr:riboflavin synthase [Desulfovibrionaceae bacterium]